MCSSDLAVLGVFRDSHTYPIVLIVPDGEHDSRPSTESALPAAREVASLKQGSNSAFRIPWLSKKLCASPTVHIMALVSHQFIDLFSMRLTARPRQRRSG